MAYTKIYPHIKGSRSTCRLNNLFWRNNIGKGIGNPQEGKKVEPKWSQTWTYRIYWYNTWKTNFFQVGISNDIHSNATYDTISGYGDHFFIYSLKKPFENQNIDLVVMMFCTWNFGTLMDLGRRGAMTSNHYILRFQNFVKLRGKIKLGPAETAGTQQLWNLEIKTGVIFSFLLDVARQHHFKYSFFNSLLP